MQPQQQTEQQSQQTENLTKTQIYELHLAPLVEALHKAAEKYGMSQVSVCEIDDPDDTDGYRMATSLHIDRPMGSAVVAIAGIATGSAPGFLVEALASIEARSKSEEDQTEDEESEE